VHSQEPAQGNKYNHNFRNRFCGCNEEYDPHKEKGTMFQCLGLGNAETGGCGEDWWHPECLIGIPRGWQKAAKSDTAVKQEGENGVAVSDAKPEEEEEESLPPGFPEEDDFETFICYKCLDSNPWLKRYANAQSFLSPVYKDGGLQSPKGTAPLGSSEEKLQEQINGSRKRKADDDDDDAEEEERDSKRTKGDKQSGGEKLKEEPAVSTAPKPKHESLPSNPPAGTFSLFVKADFREYMCHCTDCFPNLIPHPQLREEEETYEPPLSEDGDGANGGGSQGTGSLLDRGEAALSNIDRVRAIEGVMVYNHLRDKVKAFLKPFAESGQPVSAEDIKAYFEKLRGDDLSTKEAGGQASALGGSSKSDDNGGGEGGGDSRREQSGRHPPNRQKK
jgi:E3 ubiquitin-protein ligase UBR7